MKDPLQIKIIEQADEEDSDDEDDDSEPEEDSPKGTPKGPPLQVTLPIGLTHSADGKANDGAKSEAWDIPGPKNKERLPLPELPTSDTARSAPELQRLAPEDDDGHIEYKVRCNSRAAFAAL